MFNSSTPKILHLSSRMFWCGESNRILVVCRGLLDAGWRVMLGAPATSAIAKRARDLQIPLFDKVGFRRGFRLFHIFRDVILLRRLHKAESFDVVHLHTSVDTWIAILAFCLPFKRGRPLLVRTRHSDHESKSDFIHRWLYAYAIDHVIFSADALRNPLANLLRCGAITEKKLSVIHSSVNVRRFDPEKVSGRAVRDELALQDRFCIGLIGRVSREKGHILLLESLPGLVRVEPNLCCVIVGEGNMMETLKEFIIRHQLERHVIFTGFRSDIPEIIAAMDLLVVPSLRVESSPGVVKEGMAMRKVVIASNVGGVAEIITNGEDGLVIQPNSTMQLKNALLAMITNRDLRESIASRARKKVVENFSDEHLINRNMKLYQDICR